MIHVSSLSHDQTQLVSNTGTTRLSLYIPFPYMTMTHETTKNQHKATKFASITDMMFPIQDSDFLHRWNKILVLKFLPVSQAFLLSYAHLPSKLKQSPHPQVPGLSLCTLQAPGWSVKSLLATPFPASTYCCSQLSVLSSELESSPKDKGVTHVISTSPIFRSYFCFGYNAYSSSKYETRC